MKSIHEEKYKKIDDKYNIKKLEDFKMKYHSDLFLKISFGKQPVSGSQNVKCLIFGFVVTNWAHKKLHMDFSGICEHFSTEKHFNFRLCNTE